MQWSDLLWQSATACSPQCATSVITKCDKCYCKVRQLVHCNVRQVLLQSVTRVITKRDSLFTAMCDKCYYKVWQVLLQSVTCVITIYDKCYHKVWQVLLQSATGSFPTSLYSWFQNSSSLRWISFRFHRAHQYDEQYTIPHIYLDILPRASASQVHPHFHVALARDHYYGEYGDHLFQLILLTT